jgi:hypothetical protein
LKLCDACDKPLQPVFTPKPKDWNQGSPPHPDTVWTSEPDPPGSQFDNCLPIQFMGGYGMFVDDMDLKQCGPFVVICHDCAHEMCAKLPWLDKLLNPYSSHAHTTEYTEAHPEHFGWDYSYHDRHEQ